MPSSSRASSNTSYRTLASSRSTRSQSSIVNADLELDIVDDNEKDPTRLSKKTASGTSSARSTLSSSKRTSLVKSSSAGKTALKDKIIQSTSELEKVSVSAQQIVRKKTFTAAEVVSI